MSTGPPGAHPHLLAPWAGITPCLTQTGLEETRPRTWGPGAWLRAAPHCPPHFSEVCRVQELEEEVTYQGCTANVTVTRCEGICASSAR